MGDTDPLVDPKTEFPCGRNAPQEYRGDFSAFLSNSFAMKVWVQASEMEEAQNETEHPARGTPGLKIESRIRSRDRRRGLCSGADYAGERACKRWNKPPRRNLSESISAPMRPKIPRRWERCSRRTSRSAVRWTTISAAKHISNAAGPTASTSVRLTSNGVLRR